MEAGDDEEAKFEGMPGWKVALLKVCSSCHNSDPLFSPTLALHVLQIH